MSTEEPPASPDAHDPINTDQPWSAPLHAGGRLCPTCAAVVDGRYCGECGERMLDERDHSLLAFVTNAFASLTTLDNRFWRTLRGIVRPGFLTAEYVAGRRRPYLGPVQLFLLLSVVFFVLSPRLGLSTASLQGFTSSRVLGAVATPMVEAEVARRGVGRDVVAAEFARVKRTQERFMVLLAIPLFAVVMKALYRRRSYVEHLAFATHTIGSMLVLMVGYLFAFVLSVMAVRAMLGLPQAWRLSGLHVLLTVGVPVLAFLFLAIRRVHGGAMGAVLTRALLATAGLIASVVLYEYVLCFTSMAALRLGL